MCYPVHKFGAIGVPANAPRFTPGAFVMSRVGPDRLGLRVRASREPLAVAAMNVRREAIAGAASGIEVRPMRFSIVVLGWELLALELGPTAAAEDEPNVDGGYLTSYPVGFVANHERPEESGLPYREGWE